MINKPLAGDQSAGTGRGKKGSERKKKKAGRKSSIESKQLEAQRSLSEDNGCCFPIPGSSPKRRRQPITETSTSQANEDAEPLTSFAETSRAAESSTYSQVAQQSCEQASLNDQQLAPSEACSKLAEQTTCEQRVGSSKKTQDEQMNKLIDLLNAFEKQSSVIRQKVKPRLSDSNHIEATHQCASNGRSVSPASKSGTHLLTCGTEQAKGAQFYLEDDWSIFVSLPLNSPSSGLYANETEDEQQTMTANLENQQNAIWELLKTEVSYMKRLQVIIDLFQATLTKLQANSLLTEVDPRRLFGNINEIHAANRSFWTNHLLTMLTKARATGEPMDPRMLKNAVNGIRNIFRPYCGYCLELSDYQDYAKELRDSNEYFRAYMTWCESRKDCDRLELKDLLAGPMQRVTKYPLMLKVIAESSGDQQQLECLRQLMDEMREFVSEVNLRLRARQDLDRLRSIADRIDPFELGAEIYGKEADSLAREYCHLDLMAPMFNCKFNCHRQLLYNSQQPEGGFEMGLARFKDPLLSNKTEIVLLLFTDILLICKQSSNQTSRWTNRQKRLAAPGSCTSSPVRQRAPTTSDRPMMSELRQRTGSHSSANSNCNCGDQAHIVAANLMVPEPGTQRPARSRRGEFALSNENSADNQLDTDTSSIVRNTFGSKHGKHWAVRDRLRALRPPYPVERLRVYQLKDGQGVLCLQLNDNQTMSNSFCLYFSQKQQHQQLHQAASGGSLTPTGNREAHSSSEFLIGREVADLAESANANSHRLTLKQASPAYQLEYLINLAQNLARQSATYHGVNTFSCATSLPLHSVITQTRSNEEHSSPQQKEHHRSRWALHTRHKARKFKPHQQAPTDSGSELRLGLSDDVLSQSRSVSCESCTGPSSPQRQDPVQKALDEQLKCLKLNHADLCRFSVANEPTLVYGTRVNSLSPPVCDFRTQATKTTSSPCGTLNRPLANRLSPSRRTAVARTSQESQEQQCRPDWSETGRAATRDYCRQNAASNDSDALTTGDECATSAVSIDSSISTTCNQERVSREQLNRKFAASPCNPRKLLNRQDVNVTSMDQRLPLRDQKAITNDDSESSAGGSERALGVKHHRHFLRGHNEQRATAESSQGTATADQTTSAIFDSSCEQQSVDNQQAELSPPLLHRKQEGNNARAVSIESGNLADCESGSRKPLGKTTSAFYYHWHSNHHLRGTKARSGSVKNPRSPPAVTLTRPDHHPLPVGGASLPASSPVFLNIPHKQNRHSLNEESTSSSAFNKYQRTSLSPIESIASSFTSPSAGPLPARGDSIKPASSSEQLALQARGSFGKQSSLGGGSEQLQPAGGPSPGLQQGGSARALHKGVPKLQFIASTSSSRSSESNSQPTGSRNRVNVDESLNAATKSVSTSTSMLNDCLEQATVGLGKKKEKNLFRYLANILPKLVVPKRFTRQDTFRQETTTGFVEGSQNSEARDCSSAPSSPMSQNSALSCDAEVFQIYEDYSSSRTPPVYYGFHEKIRMYQEQRSANSSRTGDFLDSIRRAASLRSISFGSTGGYVPDRSVLSEPLENDCKIIR